MRSTSARIGRRHGLLHGDRALDGIDDAGKLDQGAVAHQLDDAPAVRGDLRLDQALPKRPQRRQRAGLVRRHEPAIPDHVGGQNGCEPSLDSRCRHRPARHAGFITVLHAGRLKYTAGESESFTQGRRACRKVHTPTWRADACEGDATAIFRVQTLKRDEHMASPATLKLGAVRDST
jgi:hypothetical protein